MENMAKECKQCGLKIHPGLGNRRDGRAQEAGFCCYSHLEDYEFMKDKLKHEAEHDLAKGA